MEITGEQLIPLPQQRVWEALNDPGILKTCIPGCEAIEKVSELEYKVAITAAIGPVRQGKLRPIAVSSAKRSAALPDVPTVSESGLAGYDASSWYGFLAPAGTPRPIVSKLGDETVKALGAADLKERLVSQGIEPANGGVEEFAGYLNAEIPKWANVIKAAGIPPQ